MQNKKNMYIRLSYARMRTSECLSDDSGSELCEADFNTLPEPQPAPPKYKNRGSSTNPFLSLLSKNGQLV